MAYLSIGQAARVTGLTEDTLRYYERLGLLLDVQRADSGHRRYSEDKPVMDRLRSASPRHRHVAGAHPTIREPVQELRFIQSRSNVREWMI